MENNKYFGMTLTRKWLVVQIPTALLDLTLENINDDESNRYKHLSEIFSVALSQNGLKISPDEIFKMFADNVGHSTSDNKSDEKQNASSGASGFVLAVADKSEDEYASLLADVKKKMDDHQKTSGVVVGADDVTNAINKMSVTDEAKAYLLLKLVGKKPSLVF